MSLSFPNGIKRKKPFTTRNKFRESCMNVRLTVKTDPVCEGYLITQIRFGEYLKYR